jgi:hypothetical protein
MARRNEHRLIAADYEFRVHRLANTRPHHASFASDSAAFRKIFLTRSVDARNSQNFLAMRATETPRDRSLRKYFF